LTGDRTLWVVVVVVLSEPLKKDRRVFCLGSPAAGSPAPGAARLEKAARSPARFREDRGLGASPPGSGTASPPRGPVGRASELGLGCAGLRPSIKRPIRSPE